MILGTAHGVGKTLLAVNIAAILARGGAGAGSLPAPLATLNSGATYSLVFDDEFTKSLTRKFMRDCRAFAA